MRCAIWHQTLKNDVLTVDQNAVLTNKNAEKSISFNPFVWHANSYLMFNHSHGIYMTLEWNTNGIRGKNSNCSIATKVATLIFRY